MGPGIVDFFDNATAANGSFTNTSGPLSTSNGFTQFWDTTTAANAVIENLGGVATFGGTTIFHDHATAATAVINNLGMSGGGNGGLPGATSFYDDSTASAAIIHNWPGPDTGGRTEFHGQSTAANAHIILEPGNFGGTVIFYDTSTAGSAHLDAGANGANGTIDFRNQSTAGNAVIDLNDHGGGNLRLRFFDATNAAGATINAGFSSIVQVLNNSSAGNAIITMRADSTLTFDGGFDGPPPATADHAYIDLQGGGSADPTGAKGVFGNSATGGNATIIAEGAAANGAGGAKISFNFADAGSATILLKSPTVPGNAGGSLSFNGGSGLLARVITEASSLVNVVGNVTVNNGVTSIGSIEGAGVVNLGSSALAVGGLNLNTTYSGSMNDFNNGGSFTKIGTGTFTLTGANTYLGLTTVAAGTLIVNGSITGPALVKSGATLKGTGSMGIPTVEMGGTFAPGNSPGTITVAGLNLLGGSTLQFELGATCDHIVVTNSGTVTISGRLDLSVLPGFNPRSAILFLYLKARSEVSRARFRE